jgi:hypothetical protein
MRTSIIIKKPVLEPLQRALGTLAYTICDPLGQLSPSHLHHLMSEVLQILSDKDVEAVWPIIYPSSMFETNLMRQIHAIHSDLKDLPLATTLPTPPAPLPPAIDATSLVAAMDERFEDLKKETATSLKSFADAVKASAPTHPRTPSTPQAPKNQRPPPGASAYPK